VDRVALVPDPRPGLRERPLQPGGRRDEAAGLTRDVKAGLVADTEAPRPLLHVQVTLLLAPVELGAEPVEPGVARDRERLRQVQARVDPGLDVLEDMVADRVGTRAGKRRVRGD